MIVVGVDGSDGAAAALEYAAGEADFREARLRIVSAWQGTPDGNGVSVTQSYAGSVALAPNRTAWFWT